MKNYDGVFKSNKTQSIINKGNNIYFVKKS